MSDSAGDLAFHAWVDESMHVSAGLYILAAVVCDAGGCVPIRNTMRLLLDQGQCRLHWSGESQERKEKIIGTVAQLDMAAVVVVVVGKGRVRLAGRHDRACYVRHPGPGTRRPVTTHPPR